MADADIVETACARAWSVYLLINKGVAENDARASNISRGWTGPPTTNPEPGMFLRGNRG